MLIVFLIGLIAVMYAYFGFPLLVLGIGKLLNRQVKKAPIFPTVSLIIAAYNEQRFIEERLENALSLEYPSKSLEIIVASDGSTDATDRIVERFTPRIRCLSYPRRGKLFALDDAVSEAVGDILVFSDANTLFAKDAIKKLVRNFADPQVGGVAGNKIYTRNSLIESTSQGETMYWSYDKWLKRMETLTGSTVSADGAIYAIKRDLYRKPPTTSTTDDFAISTAVIEAGFRLVFENEAIAYESAIEEAGREFSRKVRLMTRGLRGVVLRKRLLNPVQYGFYSVVLFSHKILRRLVSFFLLTMAVSSTMGALQGDSVLFPLVLLQVVFYFSALGGLFLRRTPLGKWKILLTPFFFCLGNLAATFAVINLLKGSRIEKWEPQRHLE